MELRHLRTFLAVAQARRFAAAADEMYLSPSTVTEHVQALERELGVALFRRGRTAELTDAGALLVEHARETLAHADAAVAALRAYGEGRTGHLHVGILSNGAGPLTPTVIRGFMIEFPDVRVTVHRLTFRDYLDALTERRVDLAFVRPDPHDERFAAVPLSSEARVAVVPARHRLAAAEAVTAADVLDEPFIGIDREVPGSFVDYVHLNQVRQGSRACTVDAGCVDVTDVLAAVSAGRGMATAVESFRGFENWPGVCYVPITGIEPETNVLISRRGDPSPLVAAFLASAEHTLASASGALEELSPAQATGDRRQAPAWASRVR
jgi:LysR family transcriptional regulator, benzoate and cis,cis-muconate-responsive activator of ben and cat genes